MRVTKSKKETDTQTVSNSHNSAYWEGKKKQYCVGCGGLRAAEYAKETPCSCCGSTGTQKTMPLFNEFGEVIQVEQTVPSEAKPKAPTQRERKQTGAARLATLM